MTIDLVSERYSKEIELGCPADFLGENLATEQNVSAQLKIQDGGHPSYVVQITFFPTAPTTKMLVAILWFSSIKNRMEAF